jgi:two-component system aerobic respiration control sensor histidine kinase ArcB
MLKTQKYKELNEILLNENIQLKQIIADLPGCVYWKDKNSIYLGCNSYFLDMVGLKSLDNVIGKTDYDLTWIEQAESYRKHDQEVMLFGTSSFEEQATLADGQKLTYTVIKSPLHDIDGNTIGIIGTSIDISQRKKLEDQLLIEKEKAEAASTAKSEFIANMSHDVKTPLSGIIGMAEILTNQLHDEEAIDFSKTILLAGQQLLRFFDNCLEAAQSASTELTLKKEHFNLKKLLDDISQLFQPAIKEKNLKFHIKYDNHIPEFLLGSGAGIYRILLNLLGNAVKFTKSGSITINIKLDKKSNEKTLFIKLIVKDTGMGIPKDKQKVIFERFTRLIPSYKGTYEGSGLGLYIVDKFVKAMGGEIHVKSEENRGSQFIVVLPLEIPLKSAAKYEKNKILTAPPFFINSQPKKDQLVNSHTSSEKQSTAARPCVLLVEDNLTAQKVANSILSSLNLQVDIADCGGKVLEIFEPEKYALIFMDIGLPDIPGYTITQLLRKLERKQKTANNVPIIALSAHMTEDIKKDCLNAGMDGVMTKPLTKSQAAEIITKYLHHKKTIADPLQPQMKQCSDLHLQHDSKDSKNQLAIIDENYNKELLDTLLKSLPETCREIKKAHKSNDIDVLIKIIHQLHGGLCYTHTPQLLDAVRTLEISLKKGELNKLDSLYQNMLDAIKALKNVYSLKKNK